MTFNSGTANDYLDLANQLVQVLTGRHMATVAVNAGGTGHAVGDVIDINATGSTSTEVAKIEVVTVASGVITAVRIFRGGVYTVDPTTITGNAQSATTGAGTGATFDLTFAATGWTQLTRQSVAVSAAVVAGGSGYSVSDTLTLVGGVVAPGGVAATFNVDTVSSGVVTAVSLVLAGDYEVFPSGTVLTSVSPSGGDNLCTLSVTWADKSGDTIIVLQGDAGSSIDPLVGIKTYSSETDETGANTVYNWGLFGMSAWSSLTNLHLQANVSPGFSSSDNGDITTSTTGDGSFLPLKTSDAFNISWWIFATGRRVILVAKVETASTTYYAQCSFGLLNSMGTVTELPFPAYIAGACDRKRVWYADTSALWGGLSEVISRNNGPAFVWGVEGSWLSVKSAMTFTNQSTAPNYAPENDVPRANVWPLAGQNRHNVADNQIWNFALNDGFDNKDLTLATNAVRIYRTPDTGGDLFPLYPVTYQQADSSSNKFRVFGEIDGAFWLDAADSGMSSEDRITQGGNAYTIFQNGTRLQPFSFIAIRED